MDRKSIALALATAAIQSGDLELTEENAKKVVDFYVMVANETEKAIPAPQARAVTRPGGF